MNESTLPFDLNLPAHPIVLDVQALRVRFQAVTDRRAARGTRYPLVTILPLAVLAKLIRANRVRDVAEWATHRQHELCALFGLIRPTMPHPTTWRWVFQRICDPQAITEVVADVLRPSTAEVPACGNILPSTALR